MGWRVGVKSGAKKRDAPIFSRKFLEKWSKVEYHGDTKLRKVGTRLVLMGEYQNSIDAKGRMIIPAKFRDELGYKCVLTKGLDKCLYIYPMSEWEKLKDKLSTLPMSDPEARKFVRYMYGNAQECEIDKQGRISITPTLREYAEIEKELVTVGILDKVEIWSKQVYEGGDSGMDQEPGQFADQMKAYGI